jgi:hypothetical protein
MAALTSPAMLFLVNPSPTPPVVASFADSPPQEETSAAKAIAKHARAERVIAGSSANCR